MANETRRATIQNAQKTPIFARILAIFFIFALPSSLLYLGTNRLKNEREEIQQILSGKTVTSDYLTIDPKNVEIFLKDDFLFIKIKFKENTSPP